MTRKRNKGNFLFKMYYNSKLSVQTLLKSRLLEASEDAWENFLRVQTLEAKTGKFDAEIIGICAKTLILDILIANDNSLTDLGKLYRYWEEIKENCESELSEIF